MNMNMSSLPRDPGNRHDFKEHILCNFSYIWIQVSRVDSTRAKLQSGVKKTY